MKKLLFFAAMLVAFASFTEAQIIGATNSATSPRTSKVDDSPLYRPTGASLQFELGLAGGSVGYCCQLTSFVMVGGGVAYYQDLHSDFLPIAYIEGRISTPRYKHTLFLDLKAGVVLGEKLAATAKLGYMYKNFSVGIGAGVADDHDPMPLIMFSYNLPFSGIKQALF